MESRGNDEPNKREAKVETRRIAQFKENRQQPPQCNASSHVKQSTKDLRKATHPRPRNRHVGVGIHLYIDR